VPDDASCIQNDLKATYSQQNENSPKHYLIYTIF